MAKCGGGEVGEVQESRVRRGRSERGEARKEDEGRA